MKRCMSSFGLIITELVCLQITNWYLVVQWYTVLGG